MVAPPNECELNANVKSLHFLQYVTTVHVHMLEVIGSLLTAQDIRVDSFGLDLPLLLKVHKIWSVDYQENS